MHVPLVTGRGRSGISSALAICYTYGPTPVEDAFVLCERLLDQAAGDRKADALIRASLARLDAMRGDFDEARTLYRQSRATLEEYGWNLFAALTVKMRNATRTSDEHIRRIDIRTLPFDSRMMCERCRYYGRAYGTDCAHDASPGLRSVATGS